MIKIITILLSVIISFNTWATTKQQAIKIYNNILASNHMVSHPGLRFSNDKRVNAYCGNSYIVINQGMLDRTNKNELALVIGHELAHYKLKHLTSTIKNEFDADWNGYYYVTRSGYNAYKGKSIFKKFTQRYSRTHPHPMDRYRKLPG